MDGHRDCQFLGKLVVNTPLDASLTPEHIRKAIQALTKATRLWVGYSGGIDSHVLLDLTVRAFTDVPDYQVGAIHVHHGLSQHADAWATHCEAVCAAFNIPITILSVDASVKNGGSPEACAREARYQALEDFLPEEACLLLGHHQADQAETILLRIFRGAGPLGLGGMRAKIKLGKSQIVRPLLEISKQAILSYAQSRALKWCEDESNRHNRFDRNFLRSTIMPLLEARWPEVQRAINRTGRLCAETAAAVTVLAEQDIVTVQGKGSDTLLVSKLLGLPLLRRHGVIRLWLQGLGYGFPSWDHMVRIDKEVLRAKPGAKPRLKIKNYELRRLKDQLIVIPVDCY